MSPSELISFFPVGYLLTVLIETPVLVIGLSRRHSFRRRLAAGLWLTACSYPIVVLVLPLVMEGASESIYLLVAETFAPASECALFWAAFGERELFGTRSMWRDFAAIIIANLLSFIIGVLLNRWI
jgi:hypothetical protein